MKPLPFALFLLSLAFAVRAEEAVFAPAGPKVVLAAEDVKESSGLAVSPGDGRFLWLLNDSGGAPVLYLAGTDGSNRGLCAIRGVQNLDWEDLSPFKLGGKPYLLIADTGDNASKRESCLLHIVPEPALPKPGESLSAAVSPAWTIRFVYQGGPRDCESVAVDAVAGKILLVSKRTNPPVIYELPLKPTTEALQVAKRIGTTAVPLPKWSLPIPYGTQPTGLALAPDGSAAAIVTYAGLHIFPRAKGESWATALGRPAGTVLKHSLRQAEAVAFSSNGSELRIVSEGVHSPVLLYRKGQGD